jgi:glutathione S-transferase
LRVLESLAILDYLGFDLSQLEQIKQWRDRLMQRQVWQQTQPDDEQVAIFK